MSDARSWQWVDEPGGLQALTRALQEEGWVGMDTEFMRERTYRPRLALLQCQTGERTWLVDAVAELDFTPLSAWLAGTGGKVLHSCREDLEVLAQTWAPLQWPLWDTQLAEAFLGGPLQLSYQKLVQQYTGVQLEKGETRSDWLKRPLSRAQCRYAAEDVIWLPEIRARQQQALEAAGRLAWFEEDMKALLSDAQTPPDTTRLHLGLRAARDMDEASLRRLRDLLHWREQTARARDLPRTFVLRNDALHELAWNPPAGLQQLRAMDLHPATLRHHADELLALLHGEGEYALPEPPARPPAPLERQEDKQALAALRERVGALASELGLEPALIATRRDMEHHLQWQRGQREQAGRLGRGWRQELLQT